MQQVITIHPDGSIFGLQHKRGQGLDLRQFGEAEIKRETLIEWCQPIQKWYIRWADSAGGVWSEDTFSNSDVDPEDFGGSLRRESLLGDDSTLYFADYEDAVAAEIAVIQSLQLSGVLSN